jgi:hypothetical protein
MGSRQFQIGLCCNATFAECFLFAVNQLADGRSSYGYQWANSVLMVRRNSMRDLPW